MKTKQKHAKVEQMTQTMTKSEFAALRGCSGAMVTKLIKQGRVVLDHEHRVMVEQSIILIETLKDSRGGDRSVPSSRCRAHDRANPSTSTFAAQLGLFPQQRWAKDS